VFAINAASFVVSAALVASVRGRFSGSRDEHEASGRLVAGVMFVWREPVLRTMLVAFSVYAVAVGSVLVAELPLSTSFGAGAVGYGLLSTCFGVGALVGALAGRRLTPATEHPALVWSSFVTAIGFGAVAVMPAFPPILAAMLVTGSADGLVEVAVEVIFQRRSPDAVRSRTVATLEGTFLLGLAMSFLFAGWLVDAFGPKAAYALAGGGLLVATLMLLPLLRQRGTDPTAATPGPLDPTVGSLHATGAWRRLPVDDRAEPPPTPKGAEQDG
jgi:MFS family permease